MSDEHLKRSIDEQYRDAQERRIAEQAAKLQQADTDLAQAWSLETAAANNATALSNAMMESSRHQQKRWSFKRLDESRRVDIRPSIGLDAGYVHAALMTSQLFSVLSEYHPVGTREYGWQIELSGSLIDQSYRYAFSWQNGSIPSTIRWGNSLDIFRTLRVNLPGRVNASGFAAREKHYTVTPGRPKGRIVESHPAANDTERSVLMEVTLAQDVEYQQLQHQKDTNMRTAAANGALRPDDDALSTMVRAWAISRGHDERIPAAGPSAVERCHELTVLALNAFGVRPTA
jgi:hypothetical protein